MMYLKDYCINAPSILFINSNEYFKTCKIKHQLHILLVILLYCKIMLCCQMPSIPIIVVAHIDEQWMSILIIAPMAPFGHEQMHMCYLQLSPTP